MSQRPVRRACLWGPFVAIALFILRSPAAEMRFIAPSLALVMACPAILYPRRPTLAVIIAVLLAVVSLATGFSPLGLFSLAPAAGIGLVVGLIGYSLFSRLQQAGRIAVLTLVALVLVAWTFVEWSSYLNTCRVEAVLAYSATYGGIADGWGTIRDQTPIDCTVAYANTFQIYPLYGFDLKRRLVYVPSKPGLERLDQLPAMRPVIGEDVPGEVSRVMMLGSNRQTWLENLKSSGAHYLLVAKLDLGDPSRAAHPPELDYATGERFQLMFSNEAVNVYRVNGE